MKVLITLLDEDGFIDSLDSLSEGVKEEMIKRFLHSDGYLCLSYDTETKEMTVVPRQ